MTANCAVLQEVITANEIQRLQEWLTASNKFERRIENLSQNVFMCEFNANQINLEETTAGKCCYCRVDEGESRLSIKINYKLQFLIFADVSQDHNHVETTAPSLSKAMKRGCIPALCHQ